MGVVDQQSGLAGTERGHCPLSVPGPFADYDQVLQLTTWLPLPFTNFVQLLGVFPVTFEVDVPVTDAVGPLAGIEIDTPPSGPLPVLELLVIIVDPCTCNVLVQYSTSNVTAA